MRRSSTLVGACLAIAVASPASSDPQSVSQLPSPIPVVDGQSAETVLAPELTARVLARGTMPIENPTGLFATYGYAEDHPETTAAPGDLPLPGHLIEKTKTEPDKNVYLVLDGQKGAAEGYDYGRHFLFQGHESGPARPGSKIKRGLITRLNLDADEAHRVTRMNDTDIAGVPLPPFDGITWYPFSQRLLLTAELGPDGGVWQATLDVPSRVDDISGVLGRGGYEGIQADSDGNLWIVEDAHERNAGGKEKRPHAHVYRFIPADKTDLRKGGKLQALQVIGSKGGPIVYPDPAAVLGDDVKALHAYGVMHTTRWVTIHDTAIDGFTPFDANAAAKSHRATPFKRPENGVFRPGTECREFYFAETGDTNLESKANPEHGGFGGIFVVRQKSPSADEGEVAIAMKGDKDHTGFDNVTFWSGNELMVAEDAGDKLHRQRGAFDSAYLLDLRDQPAITPRRLIAQGRDPSATIDNGFHGQDGFQNDGDNEITGIHVSDGDPSPAGLLGAKLPTPFQNGWRVFYTQQHGDNVTYELRLKN